MVAENHDALARSDAVAVEPRAPFRDHFGDAGMAHRAAMAGEGDPVPVPGEPVDEPVGCAAAGPARRRGPARGFGLRPDHSLRCPFFIALAMSRMLFDIISAVACGSSSPARSTLR